MSRATIPPCHNWTSRNSESSSLSLMLLAPSCLSTSSSSIVAGNRTLVSSGRSCPFLIRHALSSPSATTLFSSRFFFPFINYRVLSSERLWLFINLVNIMGDLTVFLFIYLHKLQILIKYAYTILFFLLQHLIFSRNRVLFPKCDIISCPRVDLWLSILVFKSA